VKTAIGLLCLLLLWAGPIAEAATVGYVPMDNRPVNLEYVVDSVRAAKIGINAPDESYIAARDRSGDVSGLWQWVFAQAATTDALVVSTDSLIYGGLVASRTHMLTTETLQQRLAMFRQLKQKYPSLRLYVFGTIMRTPKMSAGATEPRYYERFGPTIFQITALEDKREAAGLSTKEYARLQQLLTQVPAEHLNDWRSRRQKNYQVNLALQQLVREGVIDYLLLGRDDSSPLSASNQEGRWLNKAGADIGVSGYLSIPGADNLGMSMVVRAINAVTFQMPFVKLFYAPGAGGSTVASYEDRPLGETIPQHIQLSGGLKLDWIEKPDLVLAVNTPENGVTHEANGPENNGIASEATREFVRRLQIELAKGSPVAVGDVSYGNGADNALMQELWRQRLLDRLNAYSGWNTAGNTLGYAIGQGMLSLRTAEADRLKLLAVRYLDDWAYQANIRGELVQQIVYPAGNDGQWLNQLKPRLTREAGERIRRFAGYYLWPIPSETITVQFPWNRMFELGVQLR
jgi:hypothetical protein